MGEGSLTDRLPFSWLPNHLKKLDLRDQQLQAPMHFCVTSLLPTRLCPLVKDPGSEAALQLF